MNASKLIDFSKSSIVGLKAELLKKQEEVQRLKELQQNKVMPEIVQKKKLVQQKLNEGIDKEQAKDTETTEVDYDALKKSREVLEAKSRLYNKLKSNTVDEETKSKYLIDFDLKREIDDETHSKPIEDEGSKHSDNEEDYSDYNSDPENDWVDFVDTLGRSRRCLRKDLKEMKAKDAMLAATLCPPSPPTDDTNILTPTPEMMSWDMQRDMMRRKWEEQETLLLGKKDIHYQDVRFDEARPHGVGYFEFSTDEAERARQQEELQKLRAQTEQQQEAAQGLRARREQQMQVRLAAARQRRRERLGLPPESPPHEAETLNTNEEEKKECIEEENVADLEDSVKKIVPIRPWDIGKNGVAPVMSQEQWIEKKRQERPEEFAPPSSLIEGKTLEDSGGGKWKSNPNIFTSKTAKHNSPFSENLKKKHKKSKVKKGHRKGSSGPSVSDWKAVSQQKSNILPDSITCDSSNQECSSTHTNRNNFSGVSRNSDFTGSSNEAWKPTITDIDMLLSKSRASNSSLEETTKIDRLSPNPKMLAETRETTSIPPISQHKTINNECGYSLENTKMIKRIQNDTTSIHSKRTNHQQVSIHKSDNSESAIKPIVNLLEINSDDENDRSSNKCDSSNGDKWKCSKRKFAEIPPPPSMSYYIDEEKKSNQKASAKPQLADSISAGMNYLKSQAEVKNKKRLKGMLDMI